MVRLLIFIATVTGCIAGCGPSATWVRNPGPEDDGLRYYRPKPYLFIAPASIPSESEHAKESGNNRRFALYKMSLCYLPDFAEEYSIHIQPGLGASRLKLALENGWNLTAINQDLDSKTSENVNAATGLVKALVPGAGSAPFAGGANGMNANQNGQPDAVVLGHEVPIGYYEAVVGVSPNDGTKRLLGFRYVGFLPFAFDPLAMSPEDIARPGSCDVADLLYGLMLEKGVLTFKKLSEIPPPTRSIGKIP